MTRKEQKEHRREQIMQIALRLFVKQSYHGTKTAQITRESKVSEGLLFHYFPTKEALLLELVKTGVEGMRFPMSLQPVSAIDFFKQFTKLFLTYLEENPEMAQLFVFMKQVREQESIPPHIRELACSVDMIAETQQIIAAGQKEGSIRRGNPLALSNLYWCTVQGIAEQLATNPGMPLPQAEWIVDLLREK